MTTNQSHTNVLTDDQRGVLTRLANKLETGQCYNGIANDSAEIYAEAIRALLSASIAERPTAAPTKDTRFTHPGCDVCACPAGICQADHTVPAQADERTATGLGWRVRERRWPDGSLMDCFVEAPAEGDMAYGLQVLGDDYTGYGDIERKYEHCKMIVEWANRAASPSTPLAAAPIEAISNLLNDAMNRAVANGADSRSMPDEYVAIAHFVCYPHEYGCVAESTETRMTLTDDAAAAIYKAAANAILMMECKTFESWSAALVRAILGVPAVEQTPKGPWRGACEHTTANMACRLCRDKHGEDYDRRNEAASREKNKPIAELMDQYRNDGFNFDDIENVKGCALRYVQTMPDSQVRTLLYALAIQPSTLNASELLTHVKWLHYCLREAGYCIDGGKCHHGCDEKGDCWRQDGCSPLSGSRLTDDWKLPGKTEKDPWDRGEVCSVCAGKPGEWTCPKTTNDQYHPRPEAACRAITEPSKSDIEARFVADHGHRLAQLLNIDSYDIADRDAKIMEVLKYAQSKPREGHECVYENGDGVCRECAELAAEKAEITKAIDALIYAAWYSGEQDSVDNVKWQDHGDSYNQRLRSSIKEKKDKLLELLKEKK